MSTSVLIVAKAQEKKLFGHAAVKTELTLVPRPRACNCYVTWNRSTWPRALSLKTSTKARWRNISDLMDIITLYHISTPSKCPRQDMVPPTAYVPSPQTYQVIPFTGITVVINFPSGRAFRWLIHYRTSQREHTQVCRKLAALRLIPPNTWHRSVAWQQTAVIKYQTPRWNPNVALGRLIIIIRPVFRYFTPLGPRKFCAPPPLFVRIQLCVSKNNTKNWQKTKHSVFSIDLP
jgi:hypothetical protein